MEPTLVQPLDGTASRPLIRAPGWRGMVHDLLNRPSSSTNARCLQVSTYTVIVISTSCFVIASFPTLTLWAGWSVIDGTVAVLFTIEYAFRIYTAPDGRGDEDAEKAHALATQPRTAAEARLRCMRQPLVLIDLCAIAPFWVELVLPFLPLSFLQILRSLRLFRVLRMLRLAQAQLATYQPATTECPSAAETLCSTLR